MENEQEVMRLKAYIGFAQKKRALFVGRKMEERLTRGRIRLVVFTPTCSEKNEEKRKNHFKDNEDLFFIRYQGNLPLNLIAGYEKVSALGISDPHLAKAILETIKEEENEEDKHVEEKQKQ